MKTKNKIYTMLMALMCTVMLVITGCSDVFSPVDIQLFGAGNGAIVLSINGSNGRTILPSLDTDVELEVKVFTGTSVDGTEVILPADLSSPIELEAGTYTLTAKFIKEIDGGIVTIADTAPVQFTVIADELTTVNVTLTSVTTGEGFFAYDLSDFNVGGELESIFVFDEDGILADALFDGEVIGTMTLDCGVYTVVFTFANVDDELATWTETLHIFTGLTSTFAMAIDIDLFAGETVAEYLARRTAAQTARAGFLNKSGDGIKDFATGLSSIYPQEFSNDEPVIILYYVGSNFQGLNIPGWSVEIDLGDGSEEIRTTVINDSFADISFDIILCPVAEVNIEFDAGITGTISVNGINYVDGFYTHADDRKSNALIIDTFANKGTLLTITTTDDLTISVNDDAYTGPIESLSQVYTVTVSAGPIATAEAEKAAIFDEDGTGILSWATGLSPHRPQQIEKAANTIILFYVDDAGFLGLNNIPANWEINDYDFAELDKTVEQSFTVVNKGVDTVTFNVILCPVALFEVTFEEDVTDSYILLGYAGAQVQFNYDEDYSSPQRAISQIATNKNNEDTIISSSSTFIEIYLDGALHANGTGFKAVSKVYTILVKSKTSASIDIKIDYTGIKEMNGTTVNIDLTVTSSTPDTIIVDLGATTDAKTFTIRGFNGIVEDGKIEFAKSLLRAGDNVLRIMDGDYSFNVTFKVTVALD